jgi:hypothetical protein
MPRGNPVERNKFRFSQQLHCRKLVMSTSSTDPRWPTEASSLGYLLTVTFGSWEGFPQWTSIEGIVTFLLASFRDEELYHRSAAIHLGVGWI